MIEIDNPVPSYKQNELSFKYNDKSSLLLNNNNNNNNNNNKETTSLLSTSFSIPISSSSLATTTTQTSSKNNQQKITTPQQQQQKQQQQKQIDYRKRINEIIVINREKNNKFSTFIPNNNLKNVFSDQEYSYLINKINQYKPPSQIYYLILIIFFLIVFLITVVLSFYFLTIGNKLYGLGFFLLFLSVFSLIGSTITYFKKTNDYADDMREYYKRLTKNYEIKSIKFYGKFTKIGSESFYKIVNNQLFIEFPKDDQQLQQQPQPVLLYNINNTNYNNNNNNYGTFNSTSKLVDNLNIIENEKL